MTGSHRRWARALKGAALGLVGLSALLVADTDDRPDLLWYHMHDGGVGHDYGQAVCIDGEGALIAVGYSVMSTAAPTDYDGYAIKKDTCGNEVFEIVIDRATPYSEDFLHGVATDSDDNVLLTGVWSGNWGGGDGYHQAMFVRKCAPDGTEIWQDVQPIGAWCNGRSVAVDGDDDIFVVGNGFPNFTVGQEWLLWKYGPDGTLASGFPVIYDHYSGAGADLLSDIPYDVAIDPEGNVVVVGIVGVSGSGDTRNLDWHIRKYDGHGNFLWSDTYGGATNRLDYCRRVAIDADGEIYVAGYVNGGASNQSGVLDWDWHVLQWHPDGSRGWKHQYVHGAGWHEVATGIAVTDDGDIISSGYVQEPDGAPVWGFFELLDGSTGEILESEIDESDDDNAISDVDVRAWLYAGTGRRLGANGVDITAWLSGYAPADPDHEADWEVGTKQMVTWDKETFEKGEKIDILASLDGGRTWDPVKERIKNKGRFRMGAPDGPYDECHVKIRSHDRPLEFLLSERYAVGMPAITQSPGQSAVGDTATLEGRFLGLPNGKIYVGGAKAKVVKGTWTSRRVDFVIPARAKDGVISIKTKGRHDAVSQNDFDLMPTLKRVRPKKAAVGKVVTLVGTGFDEPAGSVTFNGTQAEVLQWKENKVKARVPVGATTGPVRLTTDFGYETQGPVDFVVK